MTHSPTCSGCPECVPEFAPAPAEDRVRQWRAMFHRMFFEHFVRIPPPQLCVAPMFRMQPTGVDAWTLALEKLR